MAIYTAKEKGSWFSDDTARKIRVENEVLKQELERLNKILELQVRTKLSYAVRHGAGNAILEKLARKWVVRIFCPALRMEAIEHLEQR